MPETPPPEGFSTPLTVPADALTFQAIRAAGPGGQNVNKVATAIQLRLSVSRAGLPEPVRERLEKLAGRRLTRDGEIVITAQRHRTQERNREDALSRLAALLEQARIAPKPRVATRPSRSAKARRVDDKTRLGDKKRLRTWPQE